MKKNNSMNVSKVNPFTLPWRWIKGIWGSFSRFIKRLVHPNQGRRQSKGGDDNFVISPLVGVSQFPNSDSLTVEDLFAKVRWQVPTTNNESTVATIKDEINWD